MTKSQILLVLPANTYRAQRFLDAARKLDVGVVIATDSDFSPPDYSNSVIDSFSFCDPKLAGANLAAEAKRRGISRVLAVDEAGVEVAEWTRTALEGRSVANPGILATRNKASLRKILQKQGIAQPRQFQISQSDDLFSKEIEFPVIVKPSKGSGSLGVTLANDYQELEFSLEIVNNLVVTTNIDRQQIIVEEFIPGDEYAVEVLVEDFNPMILAVFEKPDPLDGPYFAETIYITPPRLDTENLTNLEDTVLKCIVALGVKEGPIHMELRLTPSFTWVPIDIAARSIGGNCSDALQFTAAESLEELILKNVFAHKLSGITREHQASGVYMIPITKAGTLKQVDGIDEANKVRFVNKIEITLATGSKVLPLPYDNQYLGFIFAKAPTTTAVEKALREAYAQLDIKIE